jgi:quercetin dioxygenase-like cupin family protein
LRDVRRCLGLLGSAKSPERRYEMRQIERNETVTVAGGPSAERRPFALAPGDGLSVENPTGSVTTFKAMGEETGGALTAIEGGAIPGEGPPLHVHDEDELIYTFEGTLRVKLDDAIHEAPPGTFVFIPRGTPHTWQNIGSEPARFFATVMPASAAFEQFFLAYAELPPEDRGLKAFARLAAEKKAFHVLGPPLSQSHPQT